MDRWKFPLGAHWFFLDLDLSFTTVSPVPPNFGQRLESELQNIHQPVQVGTCLAGVGAAAAKVLSRLDQMKSGGGDNKYYNNMIINQRLKPGREMMG